MTITIDRLRLQLPPDFATRADSIARLVGDELARLDWPAGTAHVPRLALDPQTIPSAWSDRQIARHLAQAVGVELLPQGAWPCSR